MPVPPHPLLDDPVGQVQSMVRFELVDASSMQPTDAVAVLDAASVSFNGTGNIHRTLSGVRISEKVLRDINPFTDLLRLWWVLGDGSEWPLGAFAFGDLPRRVSSGVDTLDAVLNDQGDWFEAETGRTFSMGPRGLIISLVENVLDYYGVPYTSRVVPTSNDTRALDPIGYPATATANTILRRCSELLGCLPPYFDNVGNFVMRPPPDVDRTDADLVYLTGGGRMIAGTLVQNDNLLSAPNLFRVVGSGPSSASIVGEATVHPDLPFSREQRRRTVSRTIEVQGLSSMDQARDIARSYAAAVDGYESWEFDALADPRHDGYMLVAVDDKVYRELGWSLTLRPGGPHHHQLTAGGFPVAG